MGLYTLKHAVENGGMGVDYRTYSAIMQLFEGLFSQGTNATATNTIGTDPITMFGTPAQKAYWIPQIVQGFEADKRPGLVAFANTELGEYSGSAFKAKTAKAELSPDGKNWKLSGDWIFITGLMHAGLGYFSVNHTIVNDQDKGPSVVMLKLPFRLDMEWPERNRHLLNLADQGMEILPFLGTKAERGSAELDTIRGSGQTHIHMNHFTVPAKLPMPSGSIPAILGGAVDGKGESKMLGSLNGGRLTFTALTAALARHIARQTTAWTVDRQPDPRMISQDESFQNLGMYTYQNIQGDVNRLHIWAETLKAYTQFTAAAWDHSHNDETSVAGLSAVSKSFATTLCKSMAQSAHKLYGGAAHGLHMDNTIAEALRIAEVLCTVEGPNDALAGLFNLMSVKQFYRNPANIAKVFMPTLPQRIFNLEQGNLPWGDAFWVQSRMRRLSLLSLASVVHKVVPQMEFKAITQEIKNKGMGKFLPTIMGSFTQTSTKVMKGESYTHQRLADIYGHLLAIVANYSRLKQQNNLTVLEPKCLTQGIQLMKTHVDTEMKHIFKGSPTERAALSLGDWAGVRSVFSPRPPTQELHINTIAQHRTAFINRVREEAAAEPTPLLPTPQKEGFETPKGLYIP
jgi:alkylation response protein AidB-like acyl-CoA dehydrogenase